MRTLILWVLLSSCLALSASGPQGLKAHAIGTTGCTFNTYCNPALIAVYSEDSSVVYSGECRYGGISYGIICIKLRDTLTLPDVAVVMGKYLQYVKEEFRINSYGQPAKDKTLPGNNNTTGMVDYWRDTDDNNLKVKAWSNGKCIAVLYVSTPEEIDEPKADVYLNSIVFPQ